MKKTTPVPDLSEFCGANGVVQINEPGDIMLAMLMCRPEPGGYIKIKLRPEFVCPQNKQSSIAVLCAKTKFLADITTSSQSGVPQNGLLWLLGPESNLTKGIHIARISQLFWHQGGNLQLFAEKIGPLICEMQVLPPD